MLKKTGLGFLNHYQELLARLLIIMAAGLPDELENGGEVSEKPNPTSTPLNNATVNNTVSIVNDKGRCLIGIRK